MLRFGTKNSSEIIKLPYGQMVKEVVCSGRIQNPGALRVLFVTDIHVGMRVQKAATDMLQMAGQVGEIDVILLGGDLIRNEACWPNVSTLLEMLPEAAFRGAVIGNWEYKVGGGWPVFKKQMQAVGFVPMRNDLHTIHWNDQLICIAGLDDPRFGSRKDALLDELKKFAGFRMVVAHSPDVLEHLPSECFDLLLCGHTHGGQIRLPYYGALWTSTRMGKSFEAGRYEPFPGKVVYVSKGIGSVHLPIRMNCPREITVFEIQSNTTKGAM